MILVISHGPGTNGDAYTGTPEQLAKMWRYHLSRNVTAKAWAFDRPGGLQCRPVAGGGYAVARYFDGAHRTQRYAYLLPALRRVAGG